jgi:hypothetical protein
MPTVKARYVIDDAKSTMRRCYRGVGANKSKGHPEAFFTNPVVTARGYRFSHEAHKCDEERYKPVPQLDSVMVGNWMTRHTASSSNVSESPLTRGTGSVTRSTTGKLGMLGRGAQHVCQAFK